MTRIKLGRFNIQIHGLETYREHKFQLHKNFIP